MAFPRMTCPSGIDFRTLLKEAVASFRVHHRAKTKASALALGTSMTISKPLVVACMHACAGLKLSRAAEAQ
jgi:hypothetical protein